MFASRFLSISKDCFHGNKYYISRKKNNTFIQPSKLHTVCMSRNDPGHPQCKGSLGCFLPEQPKSSERANNMESQTQSKNVSPIVDPSINHEESQPLQPGFPRKYWKDMTTEEFSALDSERVIAILPVGAIEQHGPHLPVSVDSTLNEGVLTRALELVPGEVPVCVLPMMPVGKSNEHTAFPGTLSLSTNTLIGLWTDIGESVARAGIRKLILFNSHGGQPQIMDIVARDLRVRLNMFVVTLNWFSFGVPERMFSDEELKHGIHGGAVETSMMMNLQPHLVHTQHIQNFAPTSIAWEEQFSLLSPEGAVGFGWQSQDLHPSGASGDATQATREKGEQILEFAAEKMVQLLQEVDKFPLSNLKNGPLDHKAISRQAASDDPPNVSSHQSELTATVSDEKTTVDVYTSP